MRIVTVSAHYPPNFVSGGTLQPQRLAQGLRGRGHDVSVFAGWLGDREPLDTWTDTDSTGMDVRWVVTTPWTGWADERNWHNPAVSDLFREHLDEVRPDVVHLHSLQSLGAGLVPVAKASGATVVVTMHDFWWLCTRQFLVDTELRPCSLVVDAGVCACEQGADARDHRLGALATFLESADLVLAPSASAAEVLAANGVAPDRLEVDENGLPPLDLLDPDHRAASSGERDPGPEIDDHPAPVRFLYTGGPNPMKGAAHLVDAAQALAAVPGWSLTAYGIDGYLDDSGRDLAGLPVDVRPAFEPDDLAAILAAHDVFVLPSVMRETHSLATREALAAGLPVLCTDTLGPEEVVTHGTNGLVVPAADAGALADAVRRLASDPVLLAHLRTGAGQPFPLRTIDEQVVALDERLTRLAADVTAAGAVVSAEPAPRFVLFVCGIEGAPLRYRARLPAEALALEGIRTDVRHYRDPELLALGGQADVVVLYRVPATHQILELIGSLRSAGIPCAYDVDDLIFDPDLRDEIPALRILPPDEARLWLEGVNRYRTTLEACDAYIGSTAALVAHAGQVSGLPTHRFDNGVGRVLGRAADAAVRRPRRPGPLRLGYFSGTTTHDEDWFFVEPAVLEVLERHPDVELWLGGHLPDSPALEHLGDRLVRLPFLPWLELPGTLRDLDVNLAPLAPGSRFNEAKSAIKWLEAALVETPTVASPTGPFREAIDHGRSGLLADNPGEWIDALDFLVTDAAERARIGAAARRRALLTWSPEQQGRRYAAIVTEIARRGPRSDRRSEWVPVALDEPAMPVTLEAYPDASDPAVADGGATVEDAPPPEPQPSPHPLVDRLAPRAGRAESLARRTVASIRRQGPAATAKIGTRKIVWWARHRGDGA